MSITSQLSDYELREFFRSLLLALSLDANLSFVSTEFLSRRLDGFERTLSVLSSRLRVTHPFERQLLSELDILLDIVSQQRQYCVNLSYFALHEEEEQLSTTRTKGEKPEFVIELLNIQSVEDVDDEAFSQALCFQVTYHCRTKKDNSNTRTLYLSAYDVDEFESWLSSLRLACVDNPVSLTQYHSGRFTGKGWSCCKAATFRSSPGCKPSTIYGIPDVKRQKLSLAIAFHGFGVIAQESHYSDMPGSLPFSEGDHLTVSDASGSKEWKAFSTTSTSGYGYIPKDHVKLKDLEEEPWFFAEIPSSITAAILRDQVPGCFILRTSGLGTRTILSFRTDRTMKHIEVLLDETTQKYRVKDESDAVSYANFLQFDSIQQLLDQCKQHATLGITLEKYPTIKNADEIWRVDWGEIETREESDIDLPWSVNYGKFHNKDVLIHALPEGSSDILKEKFSNQARLMMTLNHENVVKLHGIGIKGPRNFMVQENLTNGNLSDYLMRNSSLLQSYPTELGNIMNYVINGMVYLHECRVVHGELVPKNCLVGDKGIIKISGFHCARSPWCKRPLSDELYANKVPIPAPEASQSIATFPSDVWAYGLFIYSVATVGTQPITDLQQVLTFKPAEDTLDHVGSFVEKISACLQTEPKVRPTFQELRDQVSEKVGLSTPSCSSHSLEGSLNAQALAEEVPIVKSTSRKNKESSVECFVDDNGTMAWDTTDITVSYNQEELRQRLKNAELEALKARALQKRAEAAKEAILSQVQEAETKCLKEVELMTKTFLIRLNEANDRAAAAEQARYLAEEVKRLTEEKYTLYKYESEKNMHELKSMFDDALLERDELIAALKTVGKDFNAPELISPRRRDSIHQLEEKYQRYISTSDRTIQSLKTQLNGVVRHRDQLAIDREAARNEMKDTREALEQAVKEKEEFQFRLEEAQFEIERLEEMISTMTQKRQQAERERDQLQMLTDMSLMKLRQAESEKPKKRVSLCSFPTNNEEKPTERKDPSLRKLSQQLLHLIGPSPMELQFKSDIDENDMEEGCESAACDDGGISSGGQLEQEHPMKSSREELPVTRPCKAAMPSLPQVKEFRRATPTRRRQNYSNEITSWDTGDSAAPPKLAHINYYKTKDDEKKESEEDFPTKKHEPEALIHHKEESKEAIAHSIEKHRKDSLKQFTIPTLHIEEADTDSEIDHQRGVPDIEISEFDENDLIAEEQEEQEEADEVFHGSESNQDSPMFIIGDQEGQTRIVYSFDDLPELLQGIPQTNL